MRRLLLLMAAMSSLLSCGGGSGPANPNPLSRGMVAVTLSTFATGFISPVGMVQSPDLTGRFFIVQQAGQIVILQNGVSPGTPFLDLSGGITSGGETGLLGLAFHPNFSQNGRFYVNYTRTNDQKQLQTVISEFTVSTGNPNLADLNTERILMTIDQPYNNHNGGQLAFGADGLLYIGVGDGGGSGDPLNNAQNTHVLLGKILRVDVDNRDPNLEYAIPADNPFVVAGGLPEIYAYGFRNPWRFSFDSRPSDPQKPRLFVGDVGEDSYEEIDLVISGANYGWNIMEGSHCFKPATNCVTTGLTMPIYDYPHTDGYSVIGGYVYHGSLFPNLVGSYIFGDYGNGKVWALTEAPAGTWTRTELFNSGQHISSLAVDQSGEIYIIDYAGTILQLRPL